MLGLKKKKKVIKKVSKLQVNIINSSTSTEGIISCQSSIRFDGKHQGEINAENKIVIGDKAIINGTLTADNIEIFGLVKGDSHAKCTVTLSSSAKYIGNIFTNQIIILEGAVFNGNIEMPLKTKEVQVENKNLQINMQRKKILKKIALFVCITFLLLIEAVFQVGGVAGSILGCII